MSCQYIYHLSQSQSVCAQPFQLPHTTSDAASHRRMGPAMNAMQSRHFHSHAHTPSSRSNCTVAVPVILFDANFAVRWMQFHVPTIRNPNYGREHERFGRHDNFIIQTHLANICYLHCKRESSPLIDVCFSPAFCELIGTDQKCA